MGLNDFQDRCHMTAVYPPDKGIYYCSLGLASEAGEVLGKLKKQVRGDYAYEEMKQHMVKELGDVFWYVAELARCLGVTLDTIGEQVLDKLEKRLEAGTIRGSGDVR